MGLTHCYKTTVFLHLSTVQAHDKNYRDIRLQENSRLQAIWAYLSNGADHKLAPSIQVKLNIANKEDHDSGVDPWPHLQVNDSQVKVTMPINAHYQNMSYRRHGWSYDLQIRYTDGQFLPTNHTNWPLTVATSQVTQFRNFRTPLIFP